MQKVSRRQQLMHTLPGLLLLAAFFISAGAETLIGGIPTASAAADTQIAQGSAGCTGEHRKASFGETVVVSSGEVVCGGMTAFGGQVVVYGTINGDLVTFNSNVLINGQVNGNVTLYGGSLAFLNGTHIDGDVHVCGGNWQAGTKVQLQGNVIEDCTMSLGALLTNDVGTTFRFWSTLTWVALGILLTTLLPEHVMLVRTTVKIKLRRSLVLGILSILLAPIIMTVLIALIVSIPLAIIVAVGLIAGWALGTVAIGWQVGELIISRVAPQQNTRQAQIIVGLIVLTLASSIPYIGWIISIGVGLTGLGAVLLSRYGTRLYSQPKHLLPL